jgi:hypothetical protein
MDDKTRSQLTAILTEIVDTTDHDNGEPGGGFPTRYRALATEALLILNAATPAPAVDRIAVRCAALQAAARVVLPGSSATSILETAGRVEQWILREGE